MIPLDRNMLANLWGVLHNNECAYVGNIELLLWKCTEQHIKKCTGWLFNDCLNCWKQYIYFVFRWEDDYSVRAGIVSYGEDMDSFKCTVRVRIVRQALKQHDIQTTSRSRALQVDLQSSALLNYSSWRDKETLPQAKPNCADLGEVEGKGLKGSNTNRCVSVT